MTKVSYQEYIIIEEDILLVIHAVFLDFSTSQRLLTKWHTKNFAINYCSMAFRLEWITDFLSGRTQRVLVNGEKSNLVNLLSGVPQDTVLAPLLFSFVLH